MKNLFFFFLLLGSTLFSSEYQYEITPQIGYNLAEKKSGLDEYTILGGAIQYNGFDSVINPELSILYSNADYTASVQDSKVYRVAISGVYDFQQMGPLIPLVKAGLGYENIKEAHKGETPFVDLGIGAKLPIHDNMALKLEAVYMLNYKKTMQNDSRTNNLALLAGVNFAFGASAKKEYTKSSELLNEKDDDQDGVANLDDECQDTPLGKVVNHDGCPDSLDLHVNFSDTSLLVDERSLERIKSYAKFLKRNTEYSTDIIAYTNYEGGDAYNKKLSQDRAITVQNIIIDEGVPASKVKAKGRGYTKNSKIEAELIRN